MNPNANAQPLTRLPRRPALLIIRILKWEILMMIRPRTRIPSAAEAKGFVAQLLGIKEIRKFEIGKKKRRKNGQMQLEGERGVLSEGEAMVEVPDHCPSISLLTSCRIRSIRRISSFPNCFSERYHRTKSTTSRIFSILPADAQHTST
jgi:hypothetical protein